ncbi:MAG: tetratricopeptide repeat protein, partial [Candidatus Schekmanbacteria bacterium]|nr:tetratricopeptide repeat protein [Candidatus Schekmanbacteria bacterium]
MLKGQNEDYPGAIEAFEVALAADPDQADLHVALAEACLQALRGQRGDQSLTLLMRALLEDERALL